MITHLFYVFVVERFDRFLIRAGRRLANRGFWVFHLLKLTCTVRRTFYLIFFITNLNFFEKADRFGSQNSNPKFDLEIPHFYQREIQSEIHSNL